MIMNKIKSIVNSQRTAIVILIVLNLLQLRELGLLRIKVKEMSHQLSLVELKLERNHDISK